MTGRPTIIDIPPLLRLTDCKKSEIQLHFCMLTALIARCISDSV
jgi:hypothetical protein